MLLGPKYQDPVYNTPGVPLYYSSDINIFDGWSSNICVMTILNALSDGTGLNYRSSLTGLIFKGLARTVRCFTAESMLVETSSLRISHGLIQYTRAPHGS